MNRYLFGIAVTALLMSLIANDIEDHLIHHFGQGITGDLTKDSYWYPDWSRKYDDNGQRKTFFNIHTTSHLFDSIVAVPAFLFDGWHLMKIIRQFFMGLALWAWGFFWYVERYPLTQVSYAVRNCFSFMVLYSVVVFIFHTIFYERFHLFF